MGGNDPVDVGVVVHTDADGRVGVDVGVGTGVESVVCVVCVTAGGGARVPSGVVFVVEGVPG